MAIKRSAKFFGPLLKEPEAEKTASFGETAKEVMKAKEFLIPMSMMAVGGAMNMAAAGIGSLQEARAKSKAYSGMMDLHPHFKERDEATVRRLYGTLYNLNPVMAKDPMIAGAWIDNVIERQGAFGGAHGTSNQGLLSAVPELAQIGASIASAHRGNTSRPVDFIPRTMQVGNAITGALGAIDDRAQLKEERDRAFERNALDDIHKKTGMPPSRERIVAILSAEKALRERPGLRNVLQNRPKRHVVETDEPGSTFFQEPPALPPPPEPPHGKSPKRRMVG
jgi:hypothetical protein